MVKPGMFISDRYEIIDKVGTGGMADVYKARCHRLNRFVAIKILKAEYSDDKNFVEKFRAEAQSAAGLSHPNIVNVYDVGEDNGLYYIVMELIEGITLKTFVERKEKLEVKEALAIAIQIAQGMEAAHENHIIHRDIKPQNIIISKDGKVKVTDFGIAKAASSNTITSNAMGSVHYISPEQARGGYSDERSDIYSLGITLYEMLAGRVPYIADTTVSVALLHIQGEAEPLHNLVPQIPASVEHIVEKCMQKKPEYRYQSASELIRDLKRAITSPEEDFVRIKGAEVSSSPTINISDQELNQIKNGRVRTAVPVQETEENGEAGKKMENKPAEHEENKAGAAQPQKAVQEKNMQNLEKDEKKEATKEDEDDWEEEDEIEPRLKKVMLIVGVVTAVIFLIVMIVIIAKITGIFHKTTQEPDQTSQEEILKTEDDTLSSDDEEQPEDEETEEPEEDETMKTVPSVLELSQSEAKELLENSGFLVSVKEGYSSTVREGYVMSQSPEAEEELEEGGTVTIYVSLGVQEEEKRTLTLDDLSGKTEEDVTSYLEANGLVKQTTSKYSDSVSAGYIISTSPAAGSTVTEGDTITLIVSAGPEQKMTEVPKITDITEAEAKAALTDANLSVGDVSYVYSSSYAEGVVMAQDVKAGKEVKENTSVGFTVSKGPKEETPEETEPAPAETTYYYADYYIGVENSPLDDEEEGEIKLVLTQDGKESVLYQKTITGDDFPLTNTIKSTSSSAGKLNMYLDGVDTGFQTSVTFK
jgi:serine/threonine-protein kinase